MNFLRYLSDQELLVLRWTLLPLSAILVILGIREILYPLIAFRRADATFVAKDPLPAAPQICHVSFAFEVDGEPFESTTRDTFDEKAVQRRFEGKDAQRIYYRKSDPTYIKTSRTHEMAAGLVSLLAGTALLALDLALFGYIELPW